MRDCTASRARDIAGCGRIGASVEGAVCCSKPRLCSEGRGGHCHGSSDHLVSFFFLPCYFKEENVVCHEGGGDGSRN